MVRQGALAFVILALAACTQDVDDPANFTVGNSQGNGTTTTSDGTDGGATTDIGEGSNSATSSTSGSASADTTAAAESTGPVAESGTGNCGNGAIDMGEQCDGNNLQGFNCESLGLNGGMLSCDAMMCTFDTSMCSSSTGTSG